MIRLLSFSLTPGAWKTTAVPPFTGKHMDTGLFPFNQNENTLSAVVAQAQIVDALSMTQGWLYSPWRTTEQIDSIQMP